MGDNGGYNRFDRCSCDNNLNVREEYDWADFNAVLSFVGMEPEEWDAMPLPYKVADLLAYYGLENIFGSSYWGGFAIEGLD